MIKTMKPSTISINKLNAALICLCLVVTMLYIGSSFFIPITYGVFFAFMLKPICDGYERLVKNRVVAIILTLLSVGLTFALIVYFFYFQISQVLNEVENITSKIQEAGIKLLAFFGEVIGFSSGETSAIIEEELTNAVKKPFGLLTSGLSTSGLLLANFILTIVYVFFFLLYSTAVKKFVQGQLSDTAKQEGEDTLREIQRVAANYLGGMLTVMLVLGVLNSLGLYLIGIKFALVWGFLGALLAIVPYVGTTIGGLLPFLYAIATTDTYWQPIAVIVLYFVVQSLEGNFITPKVVGNSVKINALAAVISIILGALLWGIPGIILAIPLLAMFRIVLDHIRPLKPVALLLSDELYAASDKYLTEYNYPEYRLSSLFGRKVTFDEALSTVFDEIDEEVSQADTQIITDSETE